MRILDEVGFGRAAGQSPRQALACWRDGVDVLLSWQHWYTGVRVHSYRPVLYCIVAWSFCVALMVYILLYCLLNHSTLNRFQSISPSINHEVLRSL
jgi:hypothetical protein